MVDKKLKISEHIAFLQEDRWILYSAVLTDYIV